MADTKYSKPSQYGRPLQEGPEREHKRARNMTNYAEESGSDIDLFVEINKVDDIPNATSKWIPEHRKAMKIVFINASSLCELSLTSESSSSLDSGNNLASSLKKKKQSYIEDTHYKSLILETLNRDKIRVIKDTDISGITKSLSDLAVGTIISKIRSIIIKEEADNIRIRETEVDSFMMSLLQYLRFDEWPCFVEPQYYYSFNIPAHESKHIASVVEFLVTVNRKYILLFVEDKHKGNTGSLIEWSEPQIAGEILGCAFHNLELGNIGVGTGYPVVVYAVRIVGTRFTFYKANVSREYMRDVSAHGLPKRATLEILRYPKQASDNILESWDFCDPNDRKEVLKALFALKLQVTAC